MKEATKLWGCLAGRCSGGTSDQGPAKKTSPKKCGLVYLGLGLTSLATALLIIFGKPYDIIAEQIVIFSKGGEFFEQWKKPDVNIHLKVYLFNITNKEAFLAGEEELNVEEVGPYIYREHLEHSNVTFNNNGTLTMVPSQTLEWQAELSAPHKEDDKLVVPHVSMLSYAYTSSEGGFLTRMGANTVLTSTASEPLVNMTAREFMFGYTSSLLTLGHSMRQVNFRKLGLIDRMYDISGDFATVYTGEGDYTRTGLFQLWRGRPVLPQWSGACGAISGASDGSKYRGELKPGGEILFYRKSLCRVARLRNTRVEELQGLHVHKYEFVDDEFDNGHRNANNTCFCRKKMCLPDGIQDVRDCYYGFPIALSYPHLYGMPAHGMLTAKGMRPRRSKHHSGLWVQPRIGLPIKAQIRFQVNIALPRDLTALPRAARFSNMLLPLLWFDIGIDDIPEHIAARTRFFLNTLPWVETCAMWLFMVLAALLLVAGAHRLLTRSNRSENSREECNGACSNEDRSEVTKRGLSTTEM